MAEKEETLEQLMGRALAGDAQAYAQALKTVTRMVRPYIARRINRPSDTEDIVQEILISIHKARHTYDARRPFAPLVFAIASYRLRDWLRKHYADQLRFAAPIEDAENISASNVTESGLPYESIKEEVGKLPPKQAQILELMHGQGYTAKEVAEKIGMNESAVKVAAHRAYKQLKKKLTE